MGCASADRWIRFRQGVESGPRRWSVISPGTRFAASVVPGMVPGMTVLHPDVHLGVALGAICGRNRYAADPAPVIAELRTRAGVRTDVLAMEAGKWAGYYDGEHTAVLVAAILAEVPGAAPWAEVGRSQRARPRHGTTGFGSAYLPPATR